MLGHRTLNPTWKLETQFYVQATNYSPYHPLNPLQFMQGSLVVSFCFDMSHSHTNLVPHSFFGPPDRNWCFCHPSCHNCETRGQPHPCSWQGKNMSDHVCKFLLLHFPFKFGIHDFMQFPQCPWVHGTKKTMEFVDVPSFSHDFPMFWWPPCLPSCYIHPHPLVIWPPGSLPIIPPLAAPGPRIRCRGWWDPIW